MTHNPLSDIVSGQYQKWVYPEPIIDLPGWLSDNWQWFDPSHAHRIFWPDRPYKPDMNILIAGCGTNQAAVFAYNNPQSRVVAIDVSQPSLNHQNFLRQKYTLGNLELHLLPIEQAATLGLDFDLIVSTGVLHHMASPETGLLSLARCLRPHGVAAIMLYAHYGRAGVESMQSVFRELNLRQDEASLNIVKEAIAQLPAGHPLHTYFTVAPDLQYDAGLVDTFLHGRDRSFTVENCLDLVASAGLVFHDWFFKSLYEPPAKGDAFHAAVAALPNRSRWSVMERINTSNACHFFTACRPDRPVETYRVDTTTTAMLDTIPMFRYRCGIDGDTVFRHDWQIRLSPAHAALVRLINGQRSIREILATSQPDPAFKAQNPGQFVNLARAIFRDLVNLDFLVLAIRP